MRTFLTRIKLALVWLAVFGGSAPIALWQWNAAMHKPNYGNLRLDQGWLGQHWLAVIMAGIPAIVAAIAIYFALTWLLFRRDELENFRARKRVKAARKAPPIEGQATERATSAAHSRFIERHDDDAKDITEGDAPPLCEPPYLGNLINAAGIGARLRYKGEKHLLSFGTPGSGKSTAHVVPNLATLRRSMIVIDPKGQLAAITVRRRAQMGKVIILNPFNLLVDELPHLASDGWNPLLQLDPRSDDFESGARCIAQAMSERGGAGGTSEYFETSQENLLTIAAMFERQSLGQNATLRGVRELLASPPDELLGMFAAMAQSGNYAMKVGGNRAYGRLSDKNAMTTSFQDVIETLMKNTTFLNDDRIGRDMERGKAIDFAELHKTVTTIFVILPVDQLVKQAKWLRLFVNVAMSELLKAPPRVATLPPVLFMLDEFGNLGRLPEIPNVLNIARDLRIQLWMFLQNLEQLKKSYKDEWTSFFAGSGAVTTFAVRDMETAKEICGMIGKHEVAMKGHSVGGNPLDFKRVNASESISTQVFDLMPPEELMRLGKGEMIAFVEPARYPARAHAGGYWDSRNADMFDKSQLDPNPYRMS